MNASRGDISLWLLVGIAIFMLYGGFGVLPSNLLDFLASFAAGPGEASALEEMRHILPGSLLQLWLAAGLVVTSLFLLWLAWRSAPPAATASREEVPRDDEGRQLSPALASWLLDDRRDCPRALAAELAFLASQGLVRLAIAPNGLLQVHRLAPHIPHHLHGSAQMLMEWLFRDGERLLESSDGRRLAQACESLANLLRSQADTLTGASSRMLLAIAGVAPALFFLLVAWFLAFAEGQLLLVFVMGVLGIFLALLSLRLMPSPLPWLSKAPLAVSIALSILATFVFLLALMAHEVDASQTAPAIFWRQLQAYPFNAFAAFLLGLAPAIALSMARASHPLQQQLRQLKRFIATSERQRLEHLLRKDPSRALRHPLLPYAVALDEEGYWSKSLRRGIVLHMVRHGSRGTRSAARAAAP